MHPFVHESLPGRVVFAAGAVNSLPAEVDRFTQPRVLLIAAEAERHLAARVETLLGDRVVAVWRTVRQHVPTDLADDAAAAAAAAAANLLLSVGGGSTTGLAKAVALRTGLPVLAVPTTYAGSEMTPIWGQTDKGTKTTGRDTAVLPRVVVYDPELTTGLPTAVTAASGMNALAHCVEAAYAPGASPVTTAQAMTAVEVLTDALPRAVDHPDDLDARSDALYGAFLAGSVLATAGISVHHHVCHVLGGLFDLPHAQMHAIVLPHATWAVAAADPEALRALERVLGADVPARLFDLTARLGLPTALAAIGMQDADIDIAVPRVLAATAGDPTPLTPATARRLLHAAVGGTRPDKSR
ncbi:maleylacetate reductase [Jannaschia sp. R86511]|uniref:maleylacetate reductase n=1 Tax=Jannaschia sp. R86511 TaxID=3093853 RepID=UPI0036D43466